MYVKCVELGTPKATARDVADYLQQTHQASFGNTDGANWKVIERRDVAGDHAHRSALDLLDEGASYRVLSLVICDARKAIQITVHDYLCENYEATRGQFSEIEDSITRAAGG